MIDPDGIINTSTNKNNRILIKDVQKNDYLIWDLEDEKEFKKFISTIEKEIRGSFEYKQMVTYLKDYCGMNECAFIKVQGDNKIKIEIHHYPFTLYDIVMIVYKKRVYYQEPLKVQMVARECTMLHYKLLVGLISLSVTAHQLYHDNKLFIPAGNVFGRYWLFVDLYRQFCDVDQLDTLDRIEKYSKEPTATVHDTTVLDTNYITYNVKNENYKLPSIDTLENNMNQQIEAIKQNGYRLPTVQDRQEMYRQDSIEDRKMRPCKKPIFFFERKSA